MSDPTTPSAPADALEKASPVLPVPKGSDPGDIAPDITTAPGAGTADPDRVDCGSAVITERTAAIADIGRRLDRVKADLKDRADTDAYLSSKYLIEPSAWPELVESFEHLKRIESAGRIYCYDRPSMVEAVYRYKRGSDDEIAWNVARAGRRMTRLVHESVHATLSHRYSKLSDAIAAVQEAEGGLGEPVEPRDYDPAEMLALADERGHGEVYRLHRKWLLFTEYRAYRRQREFDNLVEDEFDYMRERPDQVHRQALSEDAVRRHTATLNRLGLTEADGKPLDPAGPIESWLPARFR